MTSVELCGVSKAFPERPPILAGIDLRVADGEFVVLVGPNGSGKSTLLRLIAGLEPLSAGEIRLGDVVVNDWTPRRRNVAMVFQSAAVYPHLTVEQNLRFGVGENGADHDLNAEETFWKGRWWRQIGRRWTHRSPGEGRPRSQVQAESRSARAAVDDRVRETARRLGIESLLHRYPRQLSGGERQRVALGRAFVRQPAVFLLDEPFANADSDLRHGMRELVRGWRHEEGSVTTILVTHDHAEALAWGGRVIVLGDGQVQQDANVEQICRQPENEFVARFFGTEPLSAVTGRLRCWEGGWRLESPLGTLVLETDDRQRNASQDWDSGDGGLRQEDDNVALHWAAGREGQEVRLAWRPNGALATPAGEQETASPCVGNVQRRQLGEDGWFVVVESAAGPAILARWNWPTIPQLGQSAHVRMAWDRCWWFDPATGRNLVVDGRRLRRDG